MNKALLLTFVLMLTATVAFAQTWPGTIGIYRDREGAYSNCGCCLNDASGVSYYYILHAWTMGARGSMYAAPKPECFTGEFLADINQFSVTIGNSQTGVAVGYGDCMVWGIIHTQTMVFWTHGTTPTCCYWRVVPHPEAASGRIEVPDCNYEIAYAHGETSIINSTRYCVSECCGPPTPVEETTWGRVKALYSE